MSGLQSEFLMNVQVALKPPLVIQDGALGTRVITDVTGGTFEGPRLKGIVLPSGGDWMTYNPTLGTLNLDIRMTFQTDDGANILTQYTGRIAAPPEKFSEIFDRSKGLPDPSSYYFRKAPIYETGSEKYAWLNTIQAVGVCELTEDGIGYDAYEIK